MLQSAAPQMTPREREEHEQEKTFAEMQANLTVKLKELDVDVLKQEAKAYSLQRIPLTIIKLPLLLVAGIALCIYAAKGQEPSEAFWKLLK